MITLTRALISSYAHIYTNLLIERTNGSVWPPREMPVDETFVPPGGEVLLLSGGFGHELKRRVNKDNFADITILNKQRPDLITQLHVDYMKAGAEGITTNSYGATRHALAKVGAAEDLEDVIREAGRCAVSAVHEYRQTCEIQDQDLKQNQILPDTTTTTTAVTATPAYRRPRPILVLGSLPPLTESYQTTNVLSWDTMVQDYLHLITTLGPHVDTFLAETLSTIDEARAVVAAFARHQEIILHPMNSTLPSPSPSSSLWISFTIQDDGSNQLRSGESLHEALEVVGARPELISGLLVNCTAPGAVTRALPVLTKAARHMEKASSRGQRRVRVGGYANGFQISTQAWLAAQETEGRRVGGTSEVALPDTYYDATGIIRVEKYVEVVGEWVAGGGTVVGGCCGVS